MEIACPHCGLLRATRAEVSAPPCPRCAERAQLLGEAAAVEAGPRRGEWHVLLRGLQRGPYTLAALRQLLEREPADAEAQVWRAGMTAWLPACELPADRDSDSDAGAAPRASVAPSPAAVRQSRVLVVRDVPWSALGPHRAEPPRRAPAGVAPPAVSSVAAPLAIDARGSAREQESEDFREASTTLRPNAPVVRSRASRAAGEVTLEIPALRARSARTEDWLRWLALGSVLSIGVVALFVSLRRPAALTSRAPARAPAAAIAVVPPPPPAPPAAPPRVRPASPAPRAAPPAPAVPAPPPLPTAHAPVATTATSTQPASAPPPFAVPPTPVQVPTARTLSLRVGSAWAPIRDTTSPTARVLCSLPRGTQLTALVQRPGRRGRWFEVHCDKHQLGWVHENHLASVR